MNDVTKRVRAKLKRQRKSQNQLAIELGISKAHLSAILSGKRRPSLTVATRIEAATGIDATDFADVPQVEAQV